jgi:hypothetical protein
MGGTVAELDFPREVGVSGSAPFRAQALRASSRLAGWHTCVFFRNDAWPDSDIGARYAVGSTTLYVLRKPGDPDSWYAEAALYAVEGSESVRVVRRRMGSSAGERRPHDTLGGYAFCASVAQALHEQEMANSYYADMKQRAPWLVEHPYLGDYAQALWARELSAGAEPFPITLAEGASAEVAPILVTLREGAMSLTDPLTAALAGSGSVPHLPPRPVRLRTYPLALGEDVRAASAEIARGGRARSRILEIGAYADIVGGGPRSV